ncbi:transcriptional regulator, BolA protein family [Rhodoblastus acidophilus]|uniref:Transcriptional regulator, BolA protein family n=1 Tax=Rhodoblastus acidophilus TaxID=1074 RepID=A0A212S080_RHOAC|nr:BolA family protein [Rhodoblastus acidophilus]MCW2315002.1 BolA protein [Rhodoblastus acidophilus]PPQ36963.1 BolA family transcriptional regulator [Rhodoblastus acidophilus]RAI22501.1 BolA family transcriptional regulator [Rhodoblastus acidophilus]SNB78361.1 transcriptional regulator, BolA protein family [Rhodoblastus acidophilus]
MTLSLRERMETKLKAAFAANEIEVIDESHKHAGHLVHEGGAPQGGETHFRIRIVSPAFAGKSRVERHRAVNALLAEEFAAGMHALALEARAPGE